jgi:hypothetical protein
MKRDQRKIEKMAPWMFCSLALFVAPVTSLFVKSTAGIKRNALVRSSVAGSPSKFVPPIPETGDKTTLDLANEFLHTGSGFYSSPRPEMLSEQFVFRGPVVGPLNKKDYLETMETFKIYEAFPDISPNAWGFSVDPVNDRKVWFLVRNTGTNTGSLGLGFGITAPPSGNKVDGAPETFSILFDDDQRVKQLTVGYVADRFEGNTGGVGAALGLIRVANIPIPGATSQVFRALGWFSNKVLNNPAKTASREEDVPKWWLDLGRTERGADGA